MCQTGSVSASEAFVEVNTLHGVSVPGLDGVSQLRLQLGHGNRAVTHTHRQRDEGREKRREMVKM